MTAATGFINGVPEASLSPADRGLCYGHGLFETLRLHNGSFPLWTAHWRRMASGADKLQIPFDASTLERFVDQSLAHFPADGVVKIILTAGVGARGYRYRGDTSPTYLIQYFGLAPMSAPVILQPCAYRLPDNRHLAGIKHLNRLDQVLAASELDEGCDGLLLDGRDRVIEALSSNVFVRRHDGWCTPALTHAGVAGVMRGYLQKEVFPRLHLEVTIAEITLDEVAAAAEVFICNAVTGMRVVREIRGIGSWQAGSQTLALRDELARQLPCFAA